MFVTVGFVVVLGYLMHALVTAESERVMDGQGQQSSSKNRSQAGTAGQGSPRKAQADRFVCSICYINLDNST